MAASTRWLSWDSGWQTGPLPPFQTESTQAGQVRDEALTCPAGCHPRTLAQTIFFLVWELRASGKRQVIWGPGSPLADSAVRQTPPCLLMGAVIDRLRRVKCQGSWKVAWSSRRSMWHLPDGEHMPPIISPGTLTPPPPPSWDVVSAHAESTQPQPKLPPSSYDSYKIWQCDMPPRAGGLTHSRIGSAARTLFSRKKPQNTCHPEKLV